MAAVLPAFQINGTLLDGKVISGTIVLPALGGGSAPADPIGVLFPSLIVSGNLENNPGTGRTVTSIITLPGLSVSGNLEIGKVVTSVITLPGLSVRVQIRHIEFGDAPYLTLPSLSVSGEGFDSNIGNASVDLPALSLVAEGVSSAFGVGAFDIPVLSVSGEGLVGVLGNALLVLPRLTLETESYFNELGNLSANLPMFTLSAEALRGATGSLDQDIPPLKLSATGILSCEGTGAVTIPVLTLTSTFILQSYLNMVMNIRNAALTLYDNYDFNSLCRFNGKHLGATSTKIFDLDTGTLDDDEAIDWNFRTGYLDLEQKTTKKLRQAWLSYKSSGNIILTVIQPDGIEYEYTLEGIETDETGLRVKFGRGLASKYVALDIKNVDGSSITLDTLQLTLDKLAMRR